MLVYQEVHWHNGKRQTRLPRVAKLKCTQASIEDLDKIRDPMYILPFTE